jgi:hypothetical protein
MPHESPRLPPALAESPGPARPIPDMTANVNALVDQVRAILDGYQAAGEVLLTIDVLQWKSLLTIHVPLPT